MKLARLATQTDGDQLESAIRRVLGDTKPAQGERRSEVRSPYFCTTVLSLDKDELVRMPVYVRDLSEHGIGFFHSTPIDLGEVTATFLLSDDEVVRLKVKIIWCRRMAEYWYISGGQFVEVIHDELGYL